MSAYDGGTSGLEVEEDRHAAVEVFDGFVDGEQPAIGAAQLAQVEIRDQAAVVQRGVMADDER